MRSYIEDTVPFGTQDEAIEYAERLRKDYTLTVLGPYWQGIYWIVDVRRRTDSSTKSNNSSSATQEEVHEEHIGESD
jgi:hypothetical protein